MNLEHSNSELTTDAEDLLQQEINEAHRVALYSEKVASMLSKQTLNMVKNGEDTANAKRTIGHRLRLLVTTPDSLHDVPTIELATNAALKSEGVQVEVKEGYTDTQVGVQMRDEIKIVRRS